MNITSAILAVAITAFVFAALAFFISQINSVRKDTNDAFEKVNGRIDSFGDSIYDLIHTLTERIKKLEDSKICILDSGTDEVGNTSLYAITKVGYSTAIVSLTDDEVAVIESFIDWACLDDDFSAEKLDQDYTPMVWRWRDKK